MNIFKNLNKRTLSETLLNGASLSMIAVNLGLSPVPSAAVPDVYDPRRTMVVRGTKAWDSPHTGTVPVLLMSALKLVPFWTLLLLIFSLIFSPTPADAEQKNPLAPIQIGHFSENSLIGWEEKEFVNRTSYQLVNQGGQTVLQAEAKASASGLFKEVVVNLTTHPYLNWQWKLEKGHPPLAERTKGGDDYGARIYIIVKGGLAFWKTKAINYVWSSTEKKGATWPNAFAGKNAMLMAVRTKEDKKNVWYQEKRNVYEDFKKIFGKEIKEIHAVAIMTDSDNSKGLVRASYGDISFTTD